MLNEMDRIWVSNIQRFSLNDGPGIRTTVFLKGCFLRCPWCSNPENVYESVEPIICRDFLNYASPMLPEKLYLEIIKDKAFFGDCGGITFSGGEPLLQIRALVPLMKMLKKDGIHQCIETSLFASKENVLTAIDFMDLFFIDIKILESERCKSILGVDVKQFMDNIDLFSDKMDKVVFRIPMIGSYVATKDNLLLISEFLANVRPNRVELLEAHNMGAEKYKLLKRTVPRVEKADSELLDFFVDKLEGNGIKPIYLTL